MTSIYPPQDKQALLRRDVRVGSCVTSVAGPNGKYIRANRDLVRHAFETANRIGDLTFAMYSCKSLISNLLMARDPLVEVQREARFRPVIDVITSMGDFNQTALSGSDYQHVLSYNQIIRIELIDSATTSSKANRTPATKCAGALSDRMFDRKALAIEVAGHEPVPGLSLTVAEREGVYPCYVR